MKQRRKRVNRGRTAELATLSTAKYSVMQDHPVRARWTSASQDNS